MDKRMVEFVRALRAAGVRVSLAESQDAMYSARAIGVYHREYFRQALKTALVKEHRDQEVFDYFFPLFFSTGQPPLIDIKEQLTPEEQKTLEDALKSLMGDRDALRQLLQRLLEGQNFSKEELEEMANLSGLPGGDAMYQRSWFERRMSRQAGVAQMEKLLEDLLQQLQENGMSEEALSEIEQMLRENLQGLSEQISNFVGQSLAQQMAAQYQRKPRQDLQDIPFYRLSQQDMDTIRDEIRRLAARLRSRAAMRQKKAKSGHFDPRKTLRKNLKYGGVPLEIQRRVRQLKPSLVLICDVSTSMRYCVEFLLTLVYELQDQIRRTHSFIFISDLVDISMEFEEHQPQKAVEKVLRENPPGYYSTDLGNSLQRFEAEHMSKVDHRTTVIVFGDGRNNYNNPRLDIVERIQRRSKRLLWFCPESRSQWGTTDSDMWEYATSSDGVYLIHNLGDLARAVDQVLADG